MNLSSKDSARAQASRREFLQALSAAGVAAMMAGEPRLLWGAESGSEASIEQPRPRADACILIWMAGGMAAPETFDPKAYQPFEIDMPVEKVMSTFPAIDTAVDSIKISQGLEEIAQVMDRACLIRSHVQADLGTILHSRHQYHWHTGYVPPQTVAAPHLGAWMARVLGPRNPVMPPFINIGQRLEGIGEQEELKAFTTGGFLGRRVRAVQPPLPRGRRALGPASQGDGGVAVPGPLPEVQATGPRGPAVGVHERLPPGVDAPGDGQRRPAAQLRPRSRRLT